MQIGLLIVAFVALGILYDDRTPAGEAPDEPAHLAYVDHLVQNGALPPPRPGGRDYESYQPPLDYLASALLLRLITDQPIGGSFVPNPSFHFNEANSRAFLAHPLTAENDRVLHRLRALRLLWAAITLLLLFQLAQIYAGRDSEIALLALSPFAFSPQFIHISASINNDALVTTFSTASLLLLTHLLLRRERASACAWGAGLCSGFAFWAKASGLMLLLPVLYTVWRLIQQRKARTACHLLVGISAPLFTWIFFSAFENRSILPQFPAGTRATAPGFLKLVAGPHWLGSLWLSFWGKFGWLSVPLPGIAYLPFLFPAALVLIGMIFRPKAETVDLLLMRVALAANIASLLFFLARVYWQPQGRFLYPSLGAMVALAAAALARYKETVPVQLAIRYRYFVLALFLALAYLGLLQIESAFSVASLHRAPSSW